MQYFSYSTPSTQNTFLLQTSFSQSLLTKPSRGSVQGQLEKPGIKPQTFHTAARVRTRTSDHAHCDCRSSDACQRKHVSAGDICTADVGEGRSIHLLLLHTLINKHLYVQRQPDLHHLCTCMFFICWWRTSRSF